MQPKFCSLLHLPALLLLTAMLLPVYGQAALTWDTQRIALTTRPSDKEAVARFHFVNSGNTTITITSVHSSCGCTTAQLDKYTYGPGESGDINAVFTLGDRVGEQEKTINVTTDEAAARPVQLILHVIIPELLTYSPRLLMWKVGDKLEGKTTIITANTPLRISTIAVTSPIPTEVSARIEPMETGSKYQLIVQAVSTAQVMNVSIPALATFTDGTTQKFTIYALVR